MRAGDTLLIIDGLCPNQPPTREQEERVGCVESLLSRVGGITVIREEKGEPDRTHLESLDWGLWSAMEADGAFLMREWSDTHRWRYIHDYFVMANKPIYYEEDYRLEIEAEKLLCYTSDDMV